MYRRRTRRYARRAPRKIGGRRRKYSRRRRFGRKRGNFLQVKRTFQWTVWTPNTTTTADFWRSFTFQLGFIPSIADYVNLFDLYRIKAIRVKFVPKYDSFAGNETTAATTRVWGVQPHYIIDPYNTVTPTGTYTAATYATFAEGGNVKQRNGNQPFSVYFKPVVLDTVAGVSRRPMRSPWLQTLDATVPHGGFQMFMTDYNFSGTGFNNQGYNLFVTYYLQFKGMK